MWIHMSEALDYADPPPASPRLSILLTDLVVVYPVVVVAAFYAEWLYAWLVLGHQPRPSIDDPKDVPSSGWLSVLVIILLLGLLPAAVTALWLIAIHAMDSDGQSRRLRAQMIGLVTLWPALVLWPRWDPCRVLEWWFD